MSYVNALASLPIKINCNFDMLFSSNKPLRTMYYAAADGNRGSGNTRTVIDAIIARDPEELHALCFDDGVRIANHPQSQLLKILTALTTELDKKLDQEGRKAIAREQAASQSAQP